MGPMWVGGGLEVGPTWDAQLGPTWVPANFVRWLELGPMWAKWDLCGTNMGAQLGPIAVVPPGLAHDGLHVGPIRVPYGLISGVLHGLAHGMGSSWVPYGSHVVYYLWVLNGLAHHGHYLGPVWVIFGLRLGFTWAFPPPSGHVQINAEYRTLKSVTIF